MASAASSDIRKQLSSITECSVCCDTFIDPRQLPCIHTYCLECIKGFAGNKQPGDDVPCPMCRTVFKIPDSGISGLPSNFFVKQLKDLMVEPLGIHCEVCSSSGEDVASKKLKTMATMFCVECNERQCDACAANHGQMKMSRDHKLITMDEKGSEGVAKMVKLYCDIHKDKALELFCFDCKAPICMMCFIKTHKSHQCSDVSEVADEFRTQMTGDIEALVGTMTRCRNLIEEGERTRKEFCDQTDAIEEEICVTVYKLKRSIDEEQARLISELHSMKLDRIKQISNVVEGIEQHMSFVESLVEYCKQLRDKGTASNVAQQMSQLHSRTTSLVTLDVLQNTVDDLGTIEVVFAATTLPSQSDRTSLMVGKLIARKNATLHSKTKSVSPTLRHVIATDNRRVVGLTSINNQLFVLCDPNQEEIQVYETATFTQQRTVHVTGLKDVSWYNSLVSCTANNCLYVCDRETIYNVCLSNDKIRNWSVSGRPSGLSVNSADHLLLVTLNLSNELREYTVRGTLICTIKLQKAYITKPWHAVQLTDSQYFVSHRGPAVSGVSCINKRGQVTATYTNNSSAPLLSAPRGLVVTNAESILVVDSDNNRIVVTNFSLECARSLPVPIKDGLKRPWCIFLDVPSSRLYLGELGETRVLVFENMRLNC